MGEIVTVNVGQDSGEVDKSTRTDGGKTSSSNSTNSPDSRSDGGRGGRDGGSGGTSERPDTRTAEREQGEKLSELAILTDEELARYNTADETEKKRLLRNAKRRERYAKEKKENGGQVKPRKVNKSQTVAPTPQIDVTSLNMIVASLSSVIASRPNCEHWLLSEAEINSITVPLSKMLAESEMFVNMGQYSNQIALCMACFTVFMPRLIVTVQKQKEAKKVERTGQHTDTAVRTDKGRNSTKAKDGNIEVGNRNVGNTSSHGANNVDNVPWYGSPIY